MTYTDNIRKVMPYTPGEQPKVSGEVIKLNTNEFPYPPSPKVREALLNINEDDLRLYPNVTGEPLAGEIAGHYGFTAEEVFVGVGSDDVLSNSFLTFFNSGRPVLFPDITYSFYDVWAGLYNIPYRTVPLNESFEIVKEDYYKENGGIVIANPNAPTGIELPLSEIEDIIAHNKDSVVIIDEAYVDFGGESALPLTRKYDNLLVVQTFSKSRAAAGMRIGFAIGNKTLIRYLNDVKFSINSYTMNRMTIAAGLATLKDEGYFRDTVTRVIKTRNTAKEEFVKLGFNVLESKANFLFVSHSEKPAKEIYQYLKGRNIFVRHFDKPRIENWLRITVGTEAQMDMLVRALREVVE